MAPDPGRRRAQPVQVELRHLHRRFHDMVAVHDLSLAIGRGEFFTFLGPSGCGKTTTLRMIAGLLQPDAGEILFDGRPVTATPPWERNIGMVFQNYALWPHMTVFDNVAFGLVERKVARGAISGRVDDALRLVGLEGLGHRLPSQLSGGQQQRVALARAIVVEPALLLLDEPLSNLDARLRVQMRNELVKLQRQLGITTIYVTHDQEEALMLSTRIAVMHRGRLVQLGSPEDVYERPADVFVADFLGGANFLPGVVRGVSATVITVGIEGDEGTVLQASASRNPGFAAGDRVSICLRPEALRLAAPGGRHPATGANEITPAAEGNVIEGVVRLSNYLGSVISCELGLRAGRTLRVETAMPRHIGRIADDQRAAVHVAPEDVLLLRESQQVSEEVRDGYQGPGHA
ncbi:MAG: ABC transporter ATP-binding protein [Armatimonadota bacterium]|nr:ABC transporter ATP-binding protein [Armatimonadota bacterium]